MDKFNRLNSKIHVETGKKLTHDEYIKESMILMENKYINDDKVMLCKTKIVDDEKLLSSLLEMKSQDEIATILQAHYGIV